MVPGNQLPAPCRAEQRWGLCPGVLGEAPAGLLILGIALRAEIKLRIYLIFLIFRGVRLRHTDAWSRSSSEKSINN